MGSVEEKGLASGKHAHLEIQGFEQLDNKT